MQVIGGWTCSHFAVTSCFATTIGVGVWVHCAAGSVVERDKFRGNATVPDRDGGAVTAVGGVTRGMLVPRSGSPASVWAVSSVAMGEGHRPQRLHMLSLRASPIPASAV